MPKKMITVVALVLGAGIGSAAMAAEQASVFLLHNSVGRYLIDQGEVRAHVAAYNAAHGTAHTFWDHDYPYIGVRNPQGVLLGYAYSSLCGANNNPDGLHQLWLNASERNYISARDSILTKHDVIAFKSCYRALDFGGARTDAELDQALAQYKTWYLQMRDVFDSHPDKIFVVLSPPPRHRLHSDATVGRAARGRLLADWLRSAQYVGSPPRANLVIFDLFDLLAAADDGAPAANMLRYEYERSHSSPDSHPNELANSIVAPLLIEALLNAADDQVPVQQSSLSGLKGMFR